MYKHQRIKKIIILGSMLLIFSLPILVFADPEPEHYGGIVTCSGVNCGFVHLMTTIEKLIEEVLKFGIAFVAIVIAYAGFQYMTAQGDSGKIEQAHKMFRNALVGFVIALSAFLVVKLIVTTLETEKPADRIPIEFGER